MSPFTYQPPDPTNYLHGVREYLKAAGQEEAALLLHAGKCLILASSTYVGNDRVYTQVIFQVPPDRVAKFTDDMKERLFDAAKAVMPSETGLEVSAMEVSSILSAPPPEARTPPLNQAYFLQENTYPHDGLRFRSKTEIKIYDALKKHPVMFFPLAAAVFGDKKKDDKLEPDFVVCQGGKWGILEVMGDQYHTPTNAAKDHARGRWFNDHGIYCIMFYDAKECYNTPDAVVEDFLKRLRESR